MDGGNKQSYLGKLGIHVFPAVYFHERPALEGRESRNRNRTFVSTVRCGNVIIYL